MVLELISNLIISSWQVVLLSLMLSVPVFILVFIGSFIKKFLESKFNFSWFKAIFSSSFIILLILLFALYFGIYFDALSGLVDQQVPGQFSDRFDAVFVDFQATYNSPLLSNLIFFTILLIKRLISVLLFTIILLPFVYFGQFVFEKLHEKNKKLNSWIKIFISVFFTSLIFVLLILIFDWFLPSLLFAALFF